MQAAADARRRAAHIVLMKVLLPFLVLLSQNEGEETFGRIGLMTAYTSTSVVCASWLEKCDARGGDRRRDSKQSLRMLERRRNRVTLFTGASRRSRRTRQA